MLSAVTLKSFDVGRASAGNSKTKGFYAALTTDIGPNITCKEYELGLSLTDYQALSLSSLTDIRKYATTQNILAYLSSWSILQSKFMACGEEANLTNLDVAFVMCRLDDPKRNPEPWLNEIDYLNNCIAHIDPRYMK